MNNLKEAGARIEKLEESVSELDRAIASLTTLVKELKAEQREALSKLSLLEGKAICVPKTIFEEIKTSDVFCMAAGAHYEGIMKSFPMLAKDEQHVHDTMQVAIDVGLKAVLALKARAEG